jgi:hypothetical protein
MGELAGGRPRSHRRDRRFDQRAVCSRRGRRRGGACGGARSRRSPASASRASPGASPRGAGTSRTGAPRARASRGSSPAGSPTTGSSRRRGRRSARSQGVVWRIDVGAEDSMRTFMRLSSVGRPSAPRNTDAGARLADMSGDAVKTAHDRLRATCDRLGSIGHGLGARHGDRSRAATSAAVARCSSASRRSLRDREMSRPRSDRHRRGGAGSGPRPRRGAQAHASGR